MVKNLRNFPSFWIIPWIAFCLFSKTAALPEGFRKITHIPTKAFGDSTEIIVKFLSSCSGPEKIKIREYNVMGSQYEEVPMNENGEFTYHIYSPEPLQVSLRTGKTTFEFLVTPKEKTYNIEITCNARKQEMVTVRNSYENQAFLPFNALSKTFRESLEKFNRADLSNKDTFDRVKKLFLNYQYKIAIIQKNNPGSFTGDVLCRADILPVSDLATIDQLRQNFLKRDILVSLPFYSNSLSSRMVVNCLYLQDKTDSSFAWFDDAMSIVVKTPESARRLQQIFYDLFYFRNEEKWLINYIDWAERNGDKMFNNWVKIQLQNLKRCIPGAPFINFQLNDIAGNPRQFSETVNSAKLTLLIMYSPTCGHCKEQIPQLMPLWEKYKNKGLKIHAVASEATHKEWEDFVTNKSSTQWIHVFEQIDGKGPSAKYNVTSTPTYVLISEQGKIITRLSNLEEIIKRITGQLEQP